MTTCSCFLVLLVQYIGLAMIRGIFLSLPMKRLSSSILVLSVLLAACSPASNTPTDTTSSSSVSLSGSGGEVSYHETQVTIPAELAANFSLSEIQNMDEMEQAFGFKFSTAEKKMLEEQKFVMKPLLETKIRPTYMSDKYREFLSLYDTAASTKEDGTSMKRNDFKERGLNNALFLSSDIFFHSYNVLYTELLKEMENEVFFPAMKALSQKFYEQAASKAAANGADKEQWTKVRNYFAVPHTLFATAGEPLTQEDYSDPQGGMKDPAEVMSEFATKDKTADTMTTARAFVKTLKLDAVSEQAVLKDLETVYAAGSAGIPEIFKTEYEQYAKDNEVGFKVDFSQFTPRSHYTGSSLRRQYFRGINWYSQLPFFVKSAPLTQYAFKTSQLLAENPEQLQDYNKLESAINFLVGSSDDLMPADYLQALEVSKTASNKEAAIMEYLAKTKNPRIKNITAEYKEVGEEQTSDVLLLTKGMRFFSGKFIIDSYWTGQLTQGDEAIKPGYTQKLPPMASSLEVMTLLGSDYARSQIPTLNFYKPETKEAIDQAMKELTEETAALGDSYWQENIYTGWLWTIQSLFNWEKEQKNSLPRFMQGSLWPAKTLQTAAGFWTELRHATLLYAKQSFAELGGGPPACDPRQIPEPPKGYIEPQLQAYDRLSYLAKRTESILKEQGYSSLRNMFALESYISALDLVQQYTVKELQNQALVEKVKTVTSPDPFDDTKTCTTYELDGESDWEMLRDGIIAALENALPEPIEGPILPAKDKRAALIADVHTGGDSKNITQILYEGTGVPNVIFVAVKDANGPRLTVGFTYSQYEFTQPYGGQRMTDEDWQKNFYTGEDPYTPYEYTSLSAWPKVNPWFAPLFPKK